MNTSTSWKTTTKTMTSKSKKKLITTTTKTTLTTKTTSDDELLSRMGTTFSASGPLEDDTGDGMGGF